MPFCNRSTNPGHCFTGVFSLLHSAGKWGISTDQFDEEIRTQLDKSINNKPITSDDIQFVLTVMSKEVPYDKRSIKQIIYGMLSALTKVIIHHAISSKDTGAGKKYLLVLVAGYIPKVSMQGSQPIQGQWILNYTTLN